MEQTQLWRGYSRKFDFQNYVQLLYTNLVLLFCTCCSNDRCIFHCSKYYHWCICY